MCKKFLTLSLFLTLLTQFILIRNSKPADKVLICKGSSDLHLPASEASFNLGINDGTLICWLDAAYDGSICIQKIGLNLNPVWEPGGTRIDTGLGELYDSGSDYPLIFSDKNGGAIVIYRKKSYGREDIFAKKISRNGYFMRDPVCLSSGFNGYNFSPVAVVTFDSKLIIAWENFSNGNFDIHAQKLGLNCEKLWNNGNEIEITHNQYDQRIPAIAYNRDLIFVSWLDARNHTSNYMFDVYACKIEKDGFLTDREKLIYHNPNTMRKKIFAVSDDPRKNLLFNHNVECGADNSFVTALEDSWDNEYSRVRVIKVNNRLDVEWDKMFDSPSYQTKPLILKDATGSFNVFWNQLSESEFGIYGAGINLKGEKTWGGENGIRISVDQCKNIFPRILPCARNRNGILATGSRLFLPWVTQNNEKLFMKSINLTDESSQIGFTDEIQDEINDGECTSITSQINNLMIVYVQSNSIYAAVRKFYNENLNPGTEKVHVENFPNPFNPTTNIAFSIPADGFVRLSVFDISGRNLGDIVNKSMKAGYHTAVFDGSKYGNGLSSGVYFCRLETYGYVRTIRMTLIK